MRKLQGYAYKGVQNVASGIVIEGKLDQIMGDWA